MGFYLYGLRKWGRVAAFTGAIFYVSAPQLTNLVYFGGIAALFAQPLMPLGLHLTDRAIERSRWIAALAVFWAVVALTHVPSLLLCTIAWVIYLLILMLKQSWKRILPLFAAAGVGFGLASFFLLPAVFEQSFANIKALKAVNGGFQANMIGSGQLQLLPLSQISKMAYIYVHQGAAIAVFSTIALICCWKQRSRVWGALGFAIALAFMMSVLSTPIWQASSTLQMVQFPVRLLGMFALAGAILAAIAVQGLRSLKWRVSLILSILIVAVIVANFKYSLDLSRRLPTLNRPGQGKVVNLEAIKEIVDNPYQDNLIDLPEYRPLLKNPDSTIPTPILGQPLILFVTPPAASIELKEWKSLYRSFKVTTPTPAIVRLRTYYYPAWQARANQKNLPIEMANDGTIELKLPAGTSDVKLWYGWTPVFTIGVVLSSLSAIAIVSFWIVSSKAPQ
ncbi:hypothetical protein H6G01_00410 [Leptolyngbya sp. FACHB-17]|nr:6-pyruvoyl-tetrahydropterin synthase-related protein [Leptolyngbya sp. FACHB-17]MBD2078389.1 hypothetical protein [Leptolyngbya sp. FACHB-17]